MTTQTTPAANTFKRRIDAFLRSNATQAVLPIALVVGVTGSMMFFHWFKESVQALHEWLGLSFVAVIALHLARNRLQLGLLLKQKKVVSFGLAVAAVVVGFLSLQPAAKPNAGRLAAQALSHAPLKALPLTLNRSAADLEAQLKSLGIDPSNADMNLRDLAAQVHQPANWLLSELLSKS